MGISRGHFLLTLLVLPVPATGQRYDPLVLLHARTPSIHDLTVHDSARRRNIPVRIFLPDDTAPAPVILFSPGLGGSRAGSAYLGEHWAARGFVVVYLQHPGSDDSVWRAVPVAQRMQALKEAASLGNFVLRVRDVSAVLDQLARWNAARGHLVGNRLDLRHIGMSGHSFGAVTTQAVSGQSFLRDRISYTDRRITAAIAFSPSAPGQGIDPREAFGHVAIPWLVMTGTNDVSPIGAADVASRLTVFPALPPGGKYELVLDGAAHSAFTDAALFGDGTIRNPNHHRVILAVSTAFWEAWLRSDAGARAWLDGAGPRSVLEAKDRWQRK